MRKFYGRLFYFYIIKGHGSDVNCILYIDENTMASCSSDKSIKIWKVSKVNYKITVLETGGYL